MRFRLKRSYIAALGFLFFIGACSSENEGVIMTVRGPVSARIMGISLIHEHILVDFIGADSVDKKRWDLVKVEQQILPLLMKVKNSGCQTFIDCTPAYLGRDPLLLKALSDSSGLNIITNTGYYGAGNNKYLPKEAFSESADQLAGRWIAESENGIEGTGIKPGFIKIGVNPGKLSEIHRKLVIAAARTHLKTGLTIASHTGPAITAFEELDILREEGVSPEAFIWVHAQNEKDLSTHIKAAKMGAWVSLDGLNDNNIEYYEMMIQNMKDNNLLNRVLLSHDSGWYHPGEEEGGKINGYSAIFDKLIPILLKDGFSQDEIHQLMVINPANAFTIRIRKI